MPGEGSHRQIVGGRGNTILISLGYSTKWNLYNRFLLEEMMRLVRRPFSSSDRVEDLEKQIALAISELIARANEVGYSTRDIVNVVHRLLADHLRSNDDKEDACAG